MAMTNTNRINRQAEAMCGKGTTEATGSYAKTCSNCKAKKFDTVPVRAHNDEQYGNFPKVLCGECRNEAEEIRFECPVCEVKKAVCPDTICGDCYENGARATIRW